LRLSIFFTVSVSFYARTDCFFSLGFVGCRLLLLLFLAAQLLGGSFGFARSLGASAGTCF
jgi:hypothetical protein